MDDALVLSGGDARGDLEVGALAYLYDNGFCAAEICSTSVGSVNAIQLAHGGDVATQKAAFDRLKMVWSSALVVNDDMYDEAAWLATVDRHVRAAITSLFSGRIDVPPLLAQSVFFPPFLFAQLRRRESRSATPSPASPRRNRCSPSTRLVRRSSPS